MKKLEPVKCPFSPKLTPMEVLRDMNTKAKEHNANSEQKFSSLSEHDAKECCVLYSDSFFGYGWDRFMYLDENCTIAPSFEQLLNICKTYRNLVVKNGTRCYHAQGYEVKEFDPYGDGSIHKKLSIMFTKEYFKYPCETGTKEANGVTTAVIDLCDLYGEGRLTVYQDAQGETYYHAIRYAYDGDPEGQVYPIEGEFNQPSNYPVHYLLYNVKV